jgi:hypothetical protein
MHARKGRTIEAFSLNRLILACKVDIGREGRLRRVGREEAGKCALVAQQRVPFRV